MYEKPLYDKLSEKYQYSNMSNLNPFKPLAIWANTNSMLDKFYNRPEINIDNSPEGLKKKNTMRHMTGLGITAREYNAPIAFSLGALKESGDLFTHKDVIGNLLDSKIDFVNNQRGINFMSKNKSATTEDLMKYAYDVAGKELGGLGNKNDFSLNKPIILKAQISNTQDEDIRYPNLYDYIIKP